MLMTRVATAIGLVGIVGGALFFAPPVAFKVLVLVAVGLALDEFLRLAFPAGRLDRAIGCGYGLAVAAAHLWPAVGVSPVSLLVAGCFGVGVWHMLRAVTLERFVARVGVSVFGAVYIGLGLSYLGWLRSATHGRTLVAMTLAMAALADTFAFAVGRTIGRRKLAPMVSPNKTVEGFVAGFGGSVAAALLCRMIAWPELPLWPMVGLGLLIGLVAPLGDLIESAVKRAYHVKDAGAVLPGHGGMLDRVDAYIFSAPAVYHYMKHVVGAI